MGGRRALFRRRRISMPRMRAVEAFTDELFFVFLDDVRITDLDDTLTIEPHTRLRLVRLVALTG